MTTFSTGHAYQDVYDRRAVAYLSTSALLHNLSVMQEYCPDSRVIAMVKANGYGHGIRSVSRRLDGRVFAFGVASVDEAIALREDGVQSHIILMEGVICPKDFAVVSDLDLDLVVHDFAHLDWLIAQRPRLGDVWVKVDIGMGRLGFFPDDVPKVMAQLAKLSALIRGEIRLMGHFSNADSPQCAEHLRQAAVFSALVARYQLPASLCNSAAVITMPQCHYDFVRPGFALYGESPLPDQSADALGLKPVMTVKSRLIAIKDYPKGAGIGYGHAYHCPQAMRIGVISFGYGDGYPRSVRSGTPILVDGVSCPLIGRISMDMMTVDLSAHDHAQMGSEVVMWGNGLPISVIESYSGISRYELFTSVQNRVKFIWEE